MVFVKAGASKMRVWSSLVILCEPQQPADGPGESGPEESGSGETGPRLTWGHSLDGADFCNWGHR